MGLRFATNNNFLVVSYVKINFFDKTQNLNKVWVSIKYKDNYI